MNDEFSSPPPIYGTRYFREIIQSIFPPLAFLKTIEEYCILETISLRTNPLKEEEARMEESRNNTKNSSE